MARRTPLAPERAWGYLLDLLARRDYTEAELRDRLGRRGITGAPADELLGRLAELGLIDDARFAERWVEGRRSTRGRLALRTELQRKGVAAQLVEDELATLTDDRELAAATALLKRFAWRYRPGPPAASGNAADAHGGETKGGNVESGGNERAGDGAAERAERRRAVLRSRARAFGFLARRGFGPGVAGAALEALGWWLEEEG
ncbi:MAG TPA: regulatory protein RecX [Trueperaceae bacterium]|nr:regulatory protein RecX [Trueperaceae bacterium]